LPAALPAEEARRRALRVYERAAGELGTGRGGEGEWGSLLAALAAVDPDRAAAAAAKWGKETQGRVLVGVAQGLQDRDPEAALGVLETLPGDWARYRVQLARQVGKDHPEVARRALAEVVRQATQAPGGSAPLALAGAGEAYLDLGDRAAGEEALNRAAALVATLGSGATDSHERGVVAAALARVDVDRALRLRAAVKPGATSNRATVFAYWREMIDLAGRVARTDLPRALQILQEPAVTEGAEGGEWLVRLVGEAAGNDPQGALKLLAEAEAGAGSHPPLPSAELGEVLAGYVSVAWRTVESDPATARAAVARVRELAPRRPAHSWYRSPGAALLAAAYLGARCGDPDPRSLLLEGLSLDPSPGPWLEAYTERVTVEQLPALALLDCGDLRPVLAPILREPGSLAWFEVRAVVQALAVVAPDEAEAFLGQAAAAAPPERRAQIWSDGGAGLINALVTPPEKRLPAALAHMGFWIAEVPDE
jgi:hypothetical protein